MQARCTVNPSFCVTVVLIPEYTESIKQMVLMLLHGIVLEMFLLWQKKCFLERVGGQLKRSHNACLIKGGPQLSQSILDEKWPHCEMLDAPCFLFVVLAGQNTSIGDLESTESDPGDLWPLRLLILWRHMTWPKKTLLPICIFLIANYICKNCLMYFPSQYLMKRPIVKCKTDFSVSNRCNHPHRLSTMV